MPELRSLYEKRKQIFPKQIKGKSQRARRLSGSLLYGTLFLLPWINWGERPAIYFNLSKQHFYLFDWMFMPQDVMYFAWFLIIAAFSLFLFTTVAGRLWCGFACPQTIWTMLFVWVEEKIQGSANVRKKAEKGKLSLDFQFKKLLTHIAWLVIGFITAMSFIAYFYPIRELIVDIYHLELPLLTLFWLVLFTWLTYVDGGILREQVCIHMCPYAKFQSVMYDEHTLAVAYDPAKGEPRGSLKSAEKSGGCIDCSLCVQVCPTGIDIRDGLQIDCINCGLCVDACDEVMTSIGRENDLIKFNTLNRMAGGKLSFVRPKTVAYVVVLAIMVSLLSYTLLTRSPIEASIVRERDRIHRFNSLNELSNFYLLKVINKTEHSHQYKINLLTPGFKLINNSIITLEKGEMIEEQLIVMSPPKAMGTYDLTFEIISLDNNEVNQIIESRYIYPSLNKR